MIGKNNHKLFMEKGANKYKRYTLKKLSVGVVSVSIGFGLMFGSVEGVSADELTGTNSVVEPNNIDSLQSNEEVSDESNIDKLSETVQSESLEQAAAIDQSLEMKRQEVKTILGQSNIVGEQYTDLVTKISDAQTLDELEGILAEIKQTASLEDNQDESKQSETEHDAEEKLKNHSEDKDGELDKITPPSTEISLSKEASVENLVEVDQLNVTSDVKYTLNDVRHLLNAADIARIESGELTVQQIIEKLLNNKVELRETEVRHENGVLAAGVEKSSLSSDKQRSKTRSRRSLNGVDVEELFRPFTEHNTVRDVYDRINQMREAKLIAETEFHFLQIEVLRHLRNDIANNEQDSNNLTPKNVWSKLPNNEQILNMQLSNQAQVTVPLSHLSEKPFRRIDHQVKKELEYVNEFLKEIEKMLLTRFGTNDEGIYFSSDEYDNQAVTYASHKTRKTFHVPEIRTNADGTVTLKMSSESEGGVELKSHYAFSFNLSHELNERVKEEQLVRGLYRPERGQQSDENGDKLQNQVSSPLYEVNKYSPQNGVYPGYVGYYTSQWSDEEGYHRKRDRFAKIELTFEANNQKITDAKLSNGILSNSFNYRHRPGTSVTSQAFNEQAEELKTLLNLMTEYNQLKNKITGTKQKINDFNQSLGEQTRVLSQRDYDNLNAKHQKLKQEIEQIKTDHTTLTNKAMYDKLHQQVRTAINTSRAGIEGGLKDLYPVNDLNNNGKKDTEDITFADRKVSDAKDKQITLLSKVTELNGKPDISQEEYLQAVSLSNQFKTAIEEARHAINEIPESDIISSLNISYNEKRTQLKSALPQDNVKLPAAPTTATQTSPDSNEKNSIMNPTLINGDFSDLSQGAKVGAESVNNGVNSVPGWTVINSIQEVIPLINRRNALTATVSRNEFVNPNNNNAVVLGVSSTEFVTDNLNKGKIDIDKVGGIYQTINVTPGSELVVKFRADSIGYHSGKDQGFNNSLHAVAQAQVEISDADTGMVLKTILPPSRGHGEAVGIVNIPEGVNRVKVALSHKSARTHNISKGDLASKGWYPGAVVSDVRVSSGSHVTTEIVTQSQTYTSPNNASSPYNGKVQLRFRNNGHEKANAAFTMRLPEGVTYRSVSNGSGSYDEQSRTLTVTKNGIPAKIPNQDTYVTVDINLTFNTETPRTFEIETQNVTYRTSPDHLNAANTGRNITLGNAGSYSVTVAMYTSELQSKVNEYQAITQSFKYYNASDDLKSEYDSTIEEGRQILGNPQSTQQAINDIANRIGTAKDALNGELTNKDALQVAIDEANNTTNGPFYSRLQDIDSNLKSEYDQAIAEAQQILGNQDATQKEAKQATDKLNLAEIKVALKKYEESIETYRESYDQLPKLDNDQIFVTGKAHNGLTKLWSEININKDKAWSKVFGNSITQNFQSNFFKIDMNRRKLVEVPDKTEVSIPTEKISVHDLGADLSQKEKDIIKKAIEDSNTFLSGTKVEISDNGTATITFPDHTESEPSQETIDRSELIRELTPEEKQLLLEKEKEEAISDIESLIDLSDDERQTLKDKVVEAGTADKIVEILAEASGLSFDKLEEAKATLRDKIETLVEDEEQKETFLAEIDAAEQLEDVQAIEDLVDTYLSVEDESDVEEAKATLRDKIETLVEDEEQKDTFLAEIDAAEQLEDVQAIEDLVDTYLSVEDESDVEEAKATLRDKIETLVEDEEQKDTFLAEIDAAEQLEDVQAIEDLVDTYLSVEDESDVEEAKATLRDKIETLVEDEEQKDTFLAEIDAAEQLEDVQAIEDLVDTYLSVEDESDVEEAKATLRDKIETLVEDEEQKDTFLAEIDAAEQLEDVQAIEDLVDTYLSVEDESDVEEAKATLEAKVDALVESANQNAAFKEAIKDATTIEELSVVDDNVNSYLSVLDHEALEAAKATLTTKIGAVISEDAKKVEFLQEVDAAQTEEALAAIEARVDEEADEADEAELTDAKATLRDKIETLVEDEEQKETFLAEIDAAEQLEDVQAIEDLVDTYLSVEDESDVEEAKATLRDKIETLVEDEEQKDTFLAEIDAAEQLEDVQAIEDLVDTYLSVEDESDVEEAKATLRDKIETLVEDEEQKETFLAEIDAAEQLEDVQAIEDLVDTYLSVEDESDVEEAKATLRDKIETLVEDEEQKDTFLAEIDAAEQLEDVQAIEDLVDTYLSVEDESDVEEAKATLRDKIETLVEDEEQKDTFLAEIDAAEQLEDVQAIEDLVDTYLSVEDESDVEEAKATLRDKIETLVEDEEQKDTFLAEIDAAEQLEDVQAIEDLVDTYLSVEDESDVEEAKATLEAKVDALVESANQNAAFKEAIKDATTIEELSVVDDNVNSYLSVLDHEALEAAKATLTTKIGAVISEDAKKVEFLQEVDAAQTEEALAAIEARVDEEADEADEAELTDAKATLRDKIETLVEDEEQKETFLAEIDAAEQLEDVQAIEDLVDTYLSVEDESDVEEAKATLRDKIETLVEDEEQKDTFLAEIDAAEQLEDVQAIEDLVDTYLSVEDESDVEEAKATLRDKIETLVEDEEQKDTFLAEIDAAEQLEDVQAIEDLVDTYLSVEDESDVEEAKATLRDKIETLVEDEEQKDTFLAEIDAAEQLEDVQAIEDLVDTYLSVEDESDVEEAKATLRDKIETLVEDEEQKDTFLAEIDAAEQLEDVQAIEDLVDTYLSVEDESDVEEAKATLRDKIETLVEDEEQKDTFLAEIDAAEQLEDVQAIEDLVDTYLSVEDESDVEEAKATLRDKIETLVEDEEQKDTFLAEIDAAEQLEDVQAIEDLVDTYLSVEDESDVEEAKATLEAKVDALVESANQNAAFKEAIKDATTIEELSVVDDNVNSYLSVLDHEALEAAKATLTTKIGAVISEDAKKVEFLQEVDAAQTEEALAAIEARVDEEADEADEAELTDAKATLRDKIETLVEDEEQKETFLAEIDAAEQLEDVQAIEDLVDTYLSVEDESDVEEAKATLRDKIETLVEDEEQKDTFLAEIDAAEQLEDVQAIEDLVDTYLSVEDESDVEEAKATLRDKIETLVEDEEQKDTFLAEIDAAEQLEDVQAIEDLVDTYLSVEDESDVEEAKATLEAKVDALVESANQNAAFKEAIKDATTIEELSVVDDNVNSYLSVLDHEALEAAKATLTTKIGAVISEDAKKVEFLQEVDAAQTEEALAAIEARVDEEADEADEAELTDAKATLRDKIETLVEDEEQKETFLAEIDAAEQLEDVQAIEDLVDTYLSVEDESDVEEAKATLRDKIETLVEDEEQKDTFLAEIDAAEQLEDVQAIEDLVDTYLSVEDESDVEEAKATLRDKIETLVEDEEQKDTFLAEIDAAEQLEDVQAIEDLVDTYLSVEDESDVEEAKATLRDKIETLVEDEEQKDTFLAEIDAAEQLEDVQAIEDLVDTYLSVEDESDVEEAKATLRDKIETLVEDEEQKDTFLAEIDAAEQLEDVQAIEDLVDTYLSVEDESDVEEAKATLEAKVDALVESANQNAAFKEAIKDATTIEELSVVDDNVNSYLSVLDHEALEAAKATLTTKIGAVISEDAKKVEILQEVDAAQTEEALAAIEARVDEEADEADEAELTDAKATLRDKIETLVEDEEQKETFLAEIDAAEQLEDVQAIEDLVDTYLSVEDESDVEEAKATLRDKIETLVEDEEQKDTFLAEIDAAEQLEDVQAIEDLVDTYLSVEDESDVEEAKATLRDKIETLVEDEEQKDTFLAEIDAAEQLEDVQAIEDLVDTYLSVEDESDVEEAKATLRDKIETLVEDEEQKDTFLAEIDAAEQLEDVQAIEDLVDTYLSVEDESDVEEAKATLRDKIETLVEDEEQKDTFLAEIDAAEQLEDVQAIEDLVDTYLSVEDESDVEEAKATLRDKIETLVEDEEQKDTFLAEIDAAEQLEDVQAIEDLVDTYLSVEDESDVEEAKATLRDKIETLVEDEEQKDTFLAEIDAAEQLEDVQAIEDLVDTYLSVEDESDVEEAKATLEAKVDALVESANQNAAFKEAIKDATTIEELSVVDDNVNSYLSVLDHEALEAAKATLTTKIGAVISEDAKKVEFLQEVDAAQTEEALAAIEARVDEEADEADEAELTDAKATLRDKIETLVEDEEQKETFLAEIDAAEQLEDVQAIEDLVDTYLSVEDESDVEEAKATLEAKVDALVESANQNAAFKEAIKDATTIEELSVVDDNVNSYLSVLDHEALEAAKATLTTKIGAVISEDAKKVEFLQEVDAAQTEEALAAIEARVDEEADEADEAELTDAKATLRDKIETLVEDEEQKETFLAEIDAAEQLEDVQAIEDLVDTYLSVEDESDVEEAKATLRDKIETLVEDEEQKDTFLAEIDAAEQLEDVQAIEDLVDTYLSVEDESDVEEAKATLRDKIETLVEDEEQKDTFLAEIDAAEQLEDVQAIEDLVDTYLSVEDESDVEEAKATLRDKIETLVEDEEQKDTFLAEIDAAEQLEDVQAIEDLVDTYLSVEDESDVEEAKATLRDKIETLVEDEEQKETFLAEIDAAEQLEDVQAIEDLVDTYLRGVKAEASQSIDDAVKAKEMAIEKSDLTTEEKAALKGNVEAHANEAKATIATLDNDVEVAELASEAVTNITLMGMDDETAKATAKDTIAALSTLTPEQQDQLSQAIDKATSNKEIAQILQQAEAQAEENYKQGVKAEAEVHRKLVEAEIGSTPNNSTSSAAAEAELTREELSKSGEFSNSDGFEEENLGDYYVGSEDEADATAEDFAGEFDKNDAHGKLVESELGATPNNSASSAAAEAELTREELSKSGEFSNPDGFEEENLGDYYVGSEDEADATAEDFAGEFDKNDAHGKLVESELGATPNNSSSSAAAEAELTREELSKSGEFSNPDGFEEENLGDYYVGSEDEADATAEDFAGEFDKNDAHGKLVESELGATPNNSSSSAAAEAELTREELSKSGEFSNPDGFKEENLGDYYVGSEDEADATAEDFAGEFDKNDAHGKLVESELGATPNNSSSSAAAEAELTREELSKSGEFSNPESGNGAGTTQPEKPEFEGGTHGLGLINEKPEFPAEELARLLQVERDKAAGYIVSLPNLDTSKVNEFKTAIQNAQTVPAIEEIIQAAEALNAKSAQTTPESGNGAGTTQPEKPEFEGDTHGLGLINEKPEFPAEELARLLQVERDKAADYIASLPNLDASKANEFKAAIQHAQTVPVIEEIIQTAEVLNDELGQGKVGGEQEQPAESEGPAQPGQVESEKERPTDKPAVTDHLQKVKTQVNGQQSIQESTKQEKSGERLPDTATISWLLGVTGISTLLAGLGLKKKREDDDK